MRKSAIYAGMFVFCLSTFGLSGKVQALPLQNTKDDNRINLFEGELIATAQDNRNLKLLTQAKSEAKKVNKTQKPAVKKKPVVYTIKSGDTLSSVAKSYDTTWERIFFKNKQIQNPNLINAGDKVTIPGPKEKLKKRPIVSEAPVNTVQSSNTASTPAPSETTAATPAVAQVPQSTPTYGGGSSAGNTYYYGYCTWYAKSRRPDLPNNLGNADTWVARAVAQGIPTGSTPRVGAIGQQGMHVVYVESVNSGGTVTISEMNFNGWGVISSRTVPASSFMYIY